MCSYIFMDFKNPWKRKRNNTNAKERSTETILEMTDFKINVLR